MPRAVALTLTGLTICAVVAQAAAAQTLGQGQAPDVSWWRVVGALALCLGLAVAGALALRARLGGGGALPSALAALKLPVAGLALAEAGPRRLQLVETIRLSHQIDICLLRCDGRRILVAAGPQGVSLLSEDDWPDRAP